MSSLEILTSDKTKIMQRLLEPTEKASYQLQLHSTISIQAEHSDSIYLSQPFNSKLIYSNIHI